MISPVLNNTPVEQHQLNGRTIYVKREDLCSPYPGPSFSKIRGVYAHIKARPESTIGVLDTYHSKAGWCVAYVCSLLGKRCVNYWPRYKADLGADLPRAQQREARSLGASMVSLPAGRSAVLYHSARKHLASIYPDSYLMPNALKLPESITENAAEAERTISDLFAGSSSPVLPESGTLVISISSGTVAAGVLQGFLNMYEFEGFWDKWRVVLHMGYSRSKEATVAYIEKMSNRGMPSPSAPGSRLYIVDEGYDYADKVEIDCPFPANPHYDAKAWKWLADPQNTAWAGTEGDGIVFWNIGA